MGVGSRSLACTAHPLEFASLALVFDPSEARIAVPFASLDIHYGQKESASIDPCRASQFWTSDGGPLKAVPPE